MLEGVAMPEDGVMGVAEKYSWSVLLDTLILLLLLLKLLLGVTLIILVPLELEIGDKS